MRKINLKYKAFALKQILPCLKGLWSALSHNTLPFMVGHWDEQLPFNSSKSPGYLGLFCYL